MASERINVRTV